VQPDARDVATDSCFVAVTRIPGDRTFRVARGFAQQIGTMCAAIVISAAISTRYTDSCLHRTVRSSHLSRLNCHISEIRRHLYSKGFDLRVS
jgi:hypothetical protein